MTRPILILVIFMISSSSILSGDYSIYHRRYTSRPDQIVDLTHMEAHISPDGYSGTVKAISTFDFTCKRSVTDSIVFRAPSFFYTTVKIDGEETRHSYDGRDITVYPTKPMKRLSNHKIEFSYQSMPKAGPIYFIGWDDTTNTKRKQIWAHRPNGWIPFIEDMLTVDMYITFDSTYKIFSNGERISIEDNEDGTWTWHYQLDRKHPLFSTALVIGDYKFKDLKTKSGLPLELWYYPEQESHFTHTYLYSAEMVDFFEKFFGVSYPYKQYRQAPVIDYMYGAMETTTSTIFGDYMQIPRGAYWQRNYINVNAHELAHQWFGNAVAHLSHDDVWLTESFATFFAKMFERDLYGEDYYQNDRRKEKDKALSLASENDLPISNVRSGGVRLYQKGSLVLDMLRDILGEEEFHELIKYYFIKHQYGRADTWDFFRDLHSVTGRDLQWFFDEWILHGGEPHYVVSFEELSNSDSANIIRFKVDQAHKQTETVGLFKMPIAFEVCFSDGSHIREVRDISEKTTVVDIKLPDNKEVDFLLFDPGRRVLKTVDFSKPTEMLLRQAIGAKNMIDRYDALIALRPVPIEEKFSTLEKLFDQENFHLNKSEILFQLKDLHADKARDIFVKALSYRFAEVRQAALENTDTIPEDMEKDYLPRLKDESFINIELALDRLARSFPNKAEQYIKAVDGTPGWRGMNIAMKSLELKVDILDKQEALKSLDAFSSKRFEFETRINAINLCIKFNYFNREVAKNTIGASLHWNRKLAGCGRTALKYFARQTTMRKLLDETLSSGGFSAEEKSRVSRIMEK